MKKIKVLSGVALMATALLFSGCYTQFAMRGGGGYGYGYDRGSQDNQTPADSGYGYQNGDQNYPDSGYVDQYGDEGYPDSSGDIVNNYYGCPPYYGSDYGYNSPNLYAGLYWNSPFYDPFYWDPYGLWSYSPYYYGAFGFGALGFYPYYHNLYYGGYGFGYGHGYGGHGFTRTRDVRNLRNNDGSRNIVGTNSRGPVPAASSRISRPGTNVTTQGRNSRISRQAYMMQRRGPSRYYYRTNGPNANVRRSAPQQRTASAPRSYSPPARSYSGGGSRSSGGGASRSSSGGGGGSRSSSGGGRGR